MGNTLRILHACALLSAGIFACPDALAVSQKDAIVTVANANKQASDSSMQASTVSAMRGLMNLADRQIPSAVKNGYEAYGGYHNSVQMDANRVASIYNAFDMDTEAPGAATGAPGVAVSNSRAPAAIASASGDDSSGTPLAFRSSYNRLDPGFLYKGEAAEVSAEFERRTGMSRKQFLKELGDASEAGINVHDPRMMDKVLGKFEAFAQKIPNAEFKANLKKGIDMVPATARTGLIAQGIQKAAEFFAEEESRFALISGESVSPYKPPEAVFF